MSRGHTRESAKGPVHNKGAKGSAQRGPTQRSLRAGELVRHAVADILARGEVHDPVIEGHLVTVPEVRMSPDLRVATVYILPLGGQESSREKASSREKDNTAVLEALDRNKRQLRAEVARRVNLKFAPELRFRIDERFDEAERIDRLLRTPQVRRDLDNDDSGEPE
jgi:ribosome-binding factor A